MDENTRLLKAAWLDSAWRRLPVEARRRIMFWYEVEAFETVVARMRQRLGNYGWMLKQSPCIVYDIPWLINEPVPCPIDAYVIVQCAVPLALCVMLNWEGKNLRCAHVASFEQAAETLASWPRPTPEAVGC